jgi:mono/diheme cytochrome c family protein
MNVRPLSSWSSAQRLQGLAAALAIVIGVPAAAFAEGTPKVVGNAKAGKPVFFSTCGVCHTLRAARAVGTIGPNLDKTSLTEAVIIKAITNGGASVMSKAAAAQYPTQMTAYKNVLTPTVIHNVAAFVYDSTHK